MTKFSISTVALITSSLDSSKLTPFSPNVIFLTEMGVDQNVELERDPKKEYEEKEIQMESGILKAPKHR